MIATLKGPLCDEVHSNYVNQERTCNGIYDQDAAHLPGQ